MHPKDRTLRTYAELGRGLDRAEFVGRHPHPFLVEEGNLADETPDRANLQFSTVEIAAADARVGALLSVRILGDSRVLPVVKRASGTFEGMVFVGRADNNDLVQDDASVSKFHAFFTKDPTEDAYSLTDAGSMNGTFVNDQRLEPHASHWLQPGDVVSFGRTRAFRFQHADTLHQLACLVSA